jgi:DNA polymerase-3 subunit delta
VRAIALIDAQLEKGESAVALMRASITPTVRKLFLVRVLLDLHPDLPAHNRGAFAKAVERLPPGEQAWLPQKKAGGTNTWGLAYAAGSARGFTTGELRRGTEACLRADHALVTTQLDHRLVLHRLVMALTVSRRRARSA